MKRKKGSKRSCVTWILFSITQHHQRHAPNYYQYQPPKTNSQAKSFFIKVHKYVVSGFPFPFKPYCIWLGECSLFSISPVSFDKHTYSNLITTGVANGLIFVMLQWRVYYLPLIDWNYYNLHLTNIYFCFVDISGELEQAEAAAAAAAGVPMEVDGEPNAKAKGKRPYSNDKHLLGQCEKSL